MTDDAGPPGFSSVDSLSPPGPGWYPDGRGNIRWWNGLGWSEDLAPGQPAVVAAKYVGSAATPVRRGRMALLVVGCTTAVALVVAAVASFGSFSFTAGRFAPEPTAGTAGYYTFNGPHARPLAVGAPWGRACVPVVFNVEDSVPDAVYAQLLRVVAEARTSGLDVAIETRRHTWRPTDVYPQGLQNSDVMFVPVFSDSDGTTPGSDGKPKRDDIGWDADLAPDGQHEHLTSLSETIHLDTTGDDAAANRQVFRRFVGMSQGIYDSTSSRSALPHHNRAAPDAFSTADIKAMKVMSGCSGIDAGSGSADS